MISTIWTNLSFEPLSALVGIGTLAKNIVDLYNATGDLATKKKALEVQEVDYKLALHAVKMSFFECLSKNRNSEVSRGFPVECAQQVEEFERLAGFEELYKQRQAFKNSF